MAVANTLASASSRSAEADLREDEDHDDVLALALLMSATRKTDFCGSLLSLCAPTPSSTSMISSRAENSLFARLWPWSVSASVPDSARSTCAVMSYCQPCGRCEKRCTRLLFGDATCPFRPPVPSRPLRLWFRTFSASQACTRLCTSRSLDPLEQLSLAQVLERRVRLRVVRVVRHSSVLQPVLHTLRAVHVRLRAARQPRALQRAMRRRQPHLLQESALVGQTDKPLHVLAALPLQRRRESPKQQENIAFRQGT